MVDWQAEGVLPTWWGHESSKNWWHLLMRFLCSGPCSHVCCFWPPPFRSHLCQLSRFRLCAGYEKESFGLHISVRAQRPNRFWVRRLSCVAICFLTAVHVCPLAVTRDVNMNFFPPLQLFSSTDIVFQSHSGGLNWGPSWKSWPSTRSIWIWLKRLRWSTSSRRRA